MNLIIPTALLALISTSSTTDAHVHASVDFDDDAAVIKRIDKDYTASGARTIHLDLAPGTISIEPSADDQVHVRLEVRCSHDDDNCVERGKRMHVESDLDARVLSLSVEGFPGINNHGLYVHGTIQVPRDRAVEVELAAGKLRVGGLAGDLNVEMQAGELSLRMRERDVRSVQLRGLIGESALLVHGERYQQEGILGHRVRWSEGVGLARVTANVTVGETEVRLE
jgi:hypothetical protein